MGFAVKSMEFSFAETKLDFEIIGLKGEKKKKEKRQRNMMSLHT